MMIDEMPEQKLKVLKKTIMKDIKAIEKTLERPRFFSLRRILNLWPKQWGETYGRYFLEFELEWKKRTVNKINEALGLEERVE